MIDPTTRDATLHRLLGLRPHREGCPGEDGTGRVEAYEQHATAPGPELRHITPGTTVTAIRCLECNGIRYLEGTVDEVLDRAASA